MGAALPQSGERLGPYELIAPLGVGGMSEVHRARDTRLGRDVALKILDFEASRHPERLRLFEHEARAASAIDHPAIVAVHDVGREGEISYVVLELVEGETLQRRLLRGRLPVRKALDVAVQIGRGLAAAHARGILHNDLKPANVILTPDGRVKILDFGLAGLQKGTAAGTLSDAGETGDTLTQALFGTPGYIAPERIGGAAAEARSDVFSLGAVLYEMLAGSPAFVGAAPAEILAATMEQDPPRIEPALAPPLERVLRCALEKDPGERFQSAGDLAHALEALAPVTGAPVYYESRRKRRWLRPAAFVAAMAALVVAAAVAGYRLRERPLPSFQRVTFRYGGVASARFAPDGHTIVYSATWDGAPRLSLYSARTDTRGTSSLQLPDGDVAGVSATGELAVFPGRPYPALHDAWLSPGQGLASVPMTGGALRELLPDVVGADWSPAVATAGVHLAVVRDVDGVRRLEFPIGHVLYQVPYGLRAPRFSPNGELIALLEGDLAGKRVIVVDLKGGRRVLVEGLNSTSTALAWSPNGQEVWFSGEKITEGTRSASWRPALRAVSLSGRERVLLRVPEFMSLQDVSPDGHALVTVGTMRAEIIGRPPGEQKERNLSWHEGSSYIELSSDGRKVLFYEAGELATYMRPTDGGPAVRLCDGYATGLSPDGRWVALIGIDHYTGRFTLVPTQAGESRVVQCPRIAFWGLRWFQDGQRILVTGNEKTARLRAWVVDTRGGEPRAITPEGIGCWLVSPDGRTAACARPEGEGYLYPIDGGQPRPIVAFRPGDHLRQWSADGRYLFVTERYARPARIQRLDLETGARMLWREMAPTDFAGVVGSIDPAITPDGATWAYSVLRYLNDLYVVDGLS